MRAFLWVSFLVAALAAGVVAVHHVSAADDEAALRGLWSRYPHGRGGESDPVSFYYFHEGDIGLYRYGKVAYNNTHSYHWSANANTLHLALNKTGVTHDLRYHIEGSVGDSAPRVLVIEGDPHNPGAPETRYTFVPAPSDAAGVDDLFAMQDPPTTSPSSSTAIDNRLWMDLKKFKTGGISFSLYQLRPAGIDGRGTGWFHVGDFDDWSTESLAYRVVNVDGGGRGLDLQFLLRGDRSVTPLLVNDSERARVLSLGSDPRDFWAAHAYLDAGPSFGLLGLSSLDGTARAAATAAGAAAPVH